ncbi:diseco-3-hydroxy-5,9,17-trioxoandrosta-1(10),2 [Seminavis robusta]|uniref:Diseco-3-hydroxy-5,9,17-trioxoandrosta-1(10),2 n=1 Tax=Seminavis robusta TaxID=568900 RepID=A0A9N8E4D6_9STRA|nr:diseco-3-hydroxy-5,9,17-trioxoandrosta-1(10),2 [Seminavis robusta]|eukprot:Sro645_g180650.1 diseco-3-hydroxy-5,9,17-trioxoandrosta-1(10),2 (356) ;mRNA; r:33404-34471
MMMKISAVSFFLALVVSSSLHGCHGLSSAAVQTAPTATSTTASSGSIPALQDFDYETNDRLPWRPEGYDSWEWRGHKINYLEMGDPSKPALLLIHGFGASVYHFRYNIPALARNHHVFAVDMLGFGLSDKPIVDYNAELWRDQSSDFIDQVIQKPTTVAGNSLGGFTALYTSTVSPLVNGCVLLNGAGKFRNPELDDQEEEQEPETNALVAKLQEAFQRFIIQCSFLYTKQPARISQVLQQVYPVNAAVVDDELVQSIFEPALNPNAPEVFYRVITRTTGAKVYVDDLLEQLSPENKPLLLCWGEQDPWIRPTAANRIQELYPSAQRVSINAGHCPHDEDAPAVNAAIAQFVQSL